MNEYLNLTDGEIATVNAWMASMAATGRVVTRLPFAIGLTQAGQLGSRLATADPSRGSGPAQWDYEPAPLAIRVLDNWATTSDDLTTYIAEYWPGNPLTAVAQGVGDVAHVVVATAGEAVAAAIGIPTWALWGTVAFGAYYVLTHVGQTKSYVRQLVA